MNEQCNEEYVPDERVIKSYVWHGERCFFVSTIRRTYDTIEGSMRGLETIVWEYDWDNSKRGEIVGQFSEGGITRHQDVSVVVFGWRLFFENTSSSIPSSL